MLVRNSSHSPEINTSSSKAADVVVSMLTSCISYPGSTPGPSLNSTLKWCSTASLDYASKMEVPSANKPQRDRWPVVRKMIKKNNSLRTLHAVLYYIRIRVPLCIYFVHITIFWNHVTGAFVQSLEVIWGFFYSSFS